MLLQFPAGISEFIDDLGATHYPDANGQAEVPAGRLGCFYQAGFLPASFGALAAAVAADQALKNAAMSGDLVFVVTPATVATPATSSAWTRTVTVQLQNAAGKVHTWYNRALTTGVSIGDTSSAGTATIPSTTLTFVNGVATVVVSGNAQAWLAAETDTLTVAQETICGYTVASKTSVQTFA